MVTVLYESLRRHGRGLRHTGYAVGVEGRAGLLAWIQIPTSSYRGKPISKESGRKMAMRAARTIASKPEVMDDNSRRCSSVVSLLLDLRRYKDDCPIKSRRLMIRRLIVVPAGAERTEVNFVRPFADAGRCVGPCAVAA